MISFLSSWFQISTKSASDVCFEHVFKHSCIASFHYWECVGSQKCEMLISHALEFYTKTFLFNSTMSMEIKFGAVLRDSLEGTGKYTVFSFIIEFTHWKGSRSFRTCCRICLNHSQCLFVTHILLCNSKVTMCNFGAKVWITVRHVSWVS